MNNVEKIIGYNFKNKQLLSMALTHSSYAHEHSTESYERLEYLGDSLVNFIVAEYLFANFQVSAGELSKYRASLVSTESFAGVVKSIGLEKYILIGKSVQKISDSVLADIFESVLAAIYLDGGRDNVYDFVLKFLLKNKSNVQKIVSSHIDYRTTLQEKLQSYIPQKTMEWVLEKEEKVGNEKHFTISLLIDGKKYATATCDTHKKCEQECSKIALKKLK